MRDCACFFPGCRPIVGIGLWLGLAITGWAQPDSPLPGAADTATTPATESKLATPPETTGITGVVVDGKDGHPVIGTDVFIEGRKARTTTDVNGRYRLAAPRPESCVVVFSTYGYQTGKKRVGLLPGQWTPLNMLLEQENYVQLARMVVKAPAIKTTTGSLLKERQKALVFSDAIGAQAISRSGSGNAADAAKRITGATVVGGRYVYVRGLGDRYSTTTLNGLSLPSPDPDKRAVPMDLFPAGMIENIVTYKNFTPDKPAHSTGGAVNMNTRAFPAKLELKLSATLGFNDQTTFQDRMLTYPGGATDWLGYDDGTRALPEEVQNTDTIPPISYNKAPIAATIDSCSKSFNNIWVPRTGKGPLDQSYSLSAGQTFKPWDRPLGLFGTLLYGRKYSAYDNGFYGKYEFTKTDTSAQTMETKDSLVDARSVSDVLWGVLLNSGCEWRPGHSLKANYMFVRNAEDEARHLKGKMLYHSFDDELEIYTLHYTARHYSSGQLVGRQKWETWGGPQLDWSAAWTTTAQDEPDFRKISMFNHFENGETLHILEPSFDDFLPTRHYRTMHEDNREGTGDLTIPFRQWDGWPAECKLGWQAVHKTRTFRENEYRFKLAGRSFNGDLEEYLSYDSLGVVRIDTVRRQPLRTLFVYGTYVAEYTSPTNSYDGTYDQTAGYGMLTLPLAAKLRFIGGLRYERARVRVASLNPAVEPARLDDGDWFPSLGLVYSLRENMNLRASYGRTVARPTFRELAPFTSYEFGGGFRLSGNPHLQRCLVDNYDTRWEWFPRPGEVAAASLFGKRFYNPIGQIFVNENGDVSYQNVEDAYLVGLELEASRSFDGVAAWLRRHPRWAFAAGACDGLAAGGNLTVVHSGFKISGVEQQLKNSVYIDHPFNSRLFEGQSPYVINFHLTYDHDPSGTGLGLYYHRFGSRLDFVSFGGTPDVFERAQGSLDFTGQRQLRAGLSLKLSAKNILDATTVKYYNFFNKDEEYIRQQAGKGRSFSVTFNYAL
jgi:TonB-dependent receptor